MTQSQALNVKLVKLSLAISLEITYTVYTGPTTVLGRLVILMIALFSHDCIIVIQHNAV
jgi:hypothetical protein